MKLKKALTKDNYGMANITLLKSMHLSINVKINGVKGVFLLDTGASNSCLDLNAIKKFNIKAKKSKHKAVGAGNSEIDTKFSSKNKIKVGDITFKKSPIVLLDLTHVNGALEQMNSGKVHGVLGADILHNYDCVVDYKGLNFYIKKVVSFL